MIEGRTLAYEQAPSPLTVFACLMPAPWLGAAAGLLLALGPAAGLPDRFAPLTLAVVHLLTLGMLAPVMIGALFQLLPVVAGVTVAGARLLAPAIALACVLSAVALAVGFLGGGAWPFRLAGIGAGLLLASAGGLLIRAGWRVRPMDLTTRVLSGAGWALAATLILGIALAGKRAGWWTLANATALNLHVAWGLGGWIATLLAGVAATVLPMFWQTPRLPAWLHRPLPWAARGGLALASMLALVAPAAAWPLFRFWFALGAAVGGLGVAALCLARRRQDPAWPLWLAATACWTGAAMLALLMPWLPPWHAWPWTLGVLALIGGAVLPVNAMLGKIVSFLVWLHLRRRLPLTRRVPPMQAVIGPGLLRWQAGAALLAGTLLLLLPLAPRYLAPLGGALFALSQAGLGVLMLRALLRFRAELAAASDESRG